MQPSLITIVPTRSRPFHVKRVVEAWRDTRAFEDGAELVFVIDADDPAFAAYAQEISSAAATLTYDHQVLSWLPIPAWQPLVPKLNGAAMHLRALRDPFALGFAGDDHVPRTLGWVNTYLRALLGGGAGIVYGDDGYQGENLPTEWAMRADIVGALGRMIPAPVEHLYCDNSIRDVGREAEVLRYLPGVRIEHMHPAAGKVATDEQYDRVNSRQQNRGDRRAYREWRDLGGLAADSAVIRELFMGETDK